MFHLILQDLEKKEDPFLDSRAKTSRKAERKGLCSVTPVEAAVDRNCWVAYAIPEKGVWPP